MLCIFVDSFTHFDVKLEVRERQYITGKIFC